MVRESSRDNWLKVAVAAGKAQSDKPLGTQFTLPDESTLVKILTKQRNFYRFYSVGGGRVPGSNQYRERASRTL